MDSALEIPASESSVLEIATNTDNVSYALSELINQLEKITKAIESFKPSEHLEGARAVPSVPISDKLVLSLKEVQALTGFSKERLREAIKASDLKAQKIGNGWRVKRRDLESYVENL